MIINLIDENNIIKSRNIDVSEVEIIYKNGKIVRYSRETKYKDVIIQMSEVATLSYNENKEVNDIKEELKEEKEPKSTWEEKIKSTQEASDFVIDNIGSIFRANFTKDSLPTDKILTFEELAEKVRKKLEKAMNDSIKNSIG